jgi:hypothetical protein
VGFTDDGVVVGAGGLVSLARDANTGMAAASSSSDTPQHCYLFEELTMKRLVPDDDSQGVRRACSRTQLIHSKSCMCLQHITPGLFEQHCKRAFSSVGPKVLNADSQSIRMGLVRNKYRVLRDVTVDSRCSPSSQAVPLPKQSLFPISPAILSHLNLIESVQI